MNPEYLSLGVVGDLHGAFDRTDADLLDAEGYAAIWFVGDLGPGTRDADVRVAKAIARLRTPVLVMPGNNDAAHGPLLRAELSHQSGLASLMRASGTSLRSGAHEASADADFGGYRLHPLAVGASGVTVVTARPYSMGGDDTSLFEVLAERYGVRNLEESTAKLVATVDAVPTEAVIFLAHNGPTGLGEEPTAPYGRDFGDTPGDHGDADLRVAIEHARAKGKRVLAVVAGHMHYPLDDGRERRWLVSEGDTVHVNAARLPRVRVGAEGTEHHHVRLRITEARVEAEERWLLAV